MKISNTSALEQWNRMVPHSVEIARSFRCEGESSSTEPQEGEDPNKPKGLFDGIDLDSLPPEIRDKLVGAQTTFATLQTERDKQTKDLLERDQAARYHQSRADRAIAVGQRHNLLDAKGEPLSTTPVNQPSLEDQVMEELAATFIKNGMDPKAAPGMAKFMALARPILEKPTLQKVANVMGPTVGRLGNLEAEEILDQASDETNDPDALLHDPDIYKEVQANVRLLAQNNSEINLAVINNLKLMAAGKVMTARLKEKAKNPQREEPFVQPRQPSRIGSRVSITGGNPAIGRGTRERSIPQASNSDTESAVASTIAKLLAGTGIKPPTQR